MHKTTVVERIQNQVFELFPLARKQAIDGNLSLLDSGILDSMGILELVTALEAEFGITFSDEDMTSEAFDSIDSLAALVENKLALSLPAES